VSSDDKRLREVVTSHDGISITMPLKEMAAGCCDEVDDVASRIGSVNSIRRTNDRVQGRSTDGAGFIDAVAAQCALELNGAIVVVRGAGGSAKAIVDALAVAGARITVIARRPEAIAELTRRYPSIRVNPRSLDPVDLIVNTVPSSASERPDFVEPEYRYGPAAHAFDVVYEPRETQWLRQRREEGLTASNGLAMLAYQARHQLEWWFDRPVSMAPLLRAVGL
jgi:shikimate dehydrogenase